MINSPPLILTDERRAVYHSLLLPFAFLLLPSLVGDVRLESRAAFVEGDARGDFVGEPCPAVRCASESLGGAGLERARGVLPDASLDLYVRMLEAYDVEGVGLGSRARRGGRARLNEERGMAADFITLGGMARVPDV